MTLQLKINEEEAVRRVIEYFKNPEYKIINLKLVSKNYFFSPIDEPNRLMDEMMIDGRLTTRSLAGDLGAGDGRIALSLGARGITTIAPEIRGELCLLAYDNIDNLVARGIIEKGRVRIIPGDYEKEETYKNATIKFSDIKTIFNHSGIRPSDGLVKKIRDESPVGARLVLLSYGGRAPELDGLTLEESKMIRRKIPLLYSHIYIKK